MRKALGVVKRAPRHDKLDYNLFKQASGVKLGFAGNYRNLGCVNGVGQCHQAGKQQQRNVPYWTT